MGCANTKSTDVADPSYDYNTNRNRQQQYAYEGTYVEDPPQQRYQQRPPQTKKGGHVLGGQPVQKGSSEEERQKRLKAIEDRMNKDVFNKVKPSIKSHFYFLAKQQSDENKRQELIGKIECGYQQLHQDPPFGLRAATLDALQAQWTYVQNEIDIQRRELQKKIV